MGTHVIIIGEVEEAEVMDEKTPASYSDYHVKKTGHTAKRAFLPGKCRQDRGYRCSVCGYILKSDTLPDDFICPCAARMPATL